MAVIKSLVTLDMICITKPIYEATLLLNGLQPTDDFVLQKPPVLSIAPTANAAFIVGGKTIDSVLGFMPIDSNKYSSANPGKMAMLRHQFEDLSYIVCDEISMVGSMKLLKINFRLQDIFGGKRSLTLLSLV